MIYRVIDPDSSYHGELMRPLDKDAIKARYAEDPGNGRDCGWFDHWELLLTDNVFPDWDDGPYAGIGFMRSEVEVYQP